MFFSYLRFSIHIYLQWRYIFCENYGSNRIERAEARICYVFAVICFTSLKLFKICWGLGHTCRISSYSNDYARAEQWLLLWLTQPGQRIASASDRRAAVLCFDTNQLAIWYELNYFWPKIESENWKDVDMSCSSSLFISFRKGFQLFKSLFRAGAHWPVRCWLQQLAPALVK